MPFVLIIAGVVLLISAVRGTHQDLFRLLAGDFTGPSNFIFWFLSIVVIGAVGYIPKMKPISDGFLVLVILVLFLKKGDPTKGAGGGFFEQFERQISSTQSATPVVSPSIKSVVDGGGVNISGGGGNVNIGGGGIKINPPRIGLGPIEIDPTFGGGSNTGIGRGPMRTY